MRQSANSNEDMFFDATPKIFELARKLRMQTTPAEEHLWNYLSKNQLGVRFKRQHPINKFIADFYCHPLKLVIEIDGGIHNDAEQKEYDIGRSEELEKFGITVIRFTNDEVINDSETVLKKIKSVIARAPFSSLKGKS
ncbi:MAG: endonuclease domain-containing protein [Chitinophagales bacterium]|nr:endonuclease domain-containing protein [Chitinophagales bacterium]